MGLPILVWRAYAARASNLALGIVIDQQLPLSNRLVYSFLSPNGSPQFETQISSAAGSTATPMG